jgi:hypothetical protein
MKKLIETPEAATYAPEFREAVVNLVGIRLWFEWRYWTAFIAFIVIGTIVLGIVEGLDLPWYGRILIGCTLLVSGALLWAIFSWHLQRWALAHRREALLHAVRPPRGGEASDATKHPQNKA